jgi:hypothetical protein
MSPGLCEFYPESKKVPFPCISISDKAFQYVTASHATVHVCWLNPTNRKRNVVPCSRRAIRMHHRIREFPVNVRVRVRQP